MIEAPSRAALRGDVPRVLIPSSPELIDDSYGVVREKFAGTRYLTDLISQVVTEAFASRSENLPLFHGAVSAPELSNMKLVAYLTEGKVYISARREEDPVAASF